MRLIRGYWKSIVVYIGILYVSLVRDPGINLPTFIGADKWVHALMYALLGGVCCWDSIRLKMSGWPLWLIAVLIPMLYGGIIEIMQEQWFAPRSGEWLDWMADCIGVAVGAVLTMIIKRLYDNRHARRMVK
jgi:VanZ family protein